MKSFFGSASRDARKQRQSPRIAILESSDDDAVSEAEDGMLDHRGEEGLASASQIISNTSTAIRPAGDAGGYGGDTGTALRVEAAAAEPDLLQYTLERLFYGPGCSFRGL